MWPTHGHDCIFFWSILLISNSMVSRGIWKNIHSWVFKDFKLHSSFGLVQFWSSLKNSLVHVFPKLHSKWHTITYTYTYTVYSWSHISRWYVNYFSSESLEERASFSGLSLVFEILALEPFISCRWWPVYIKV